MAASGRKNNFSKKLIEQTERSARIIGVFENHGFEISSMEKFQAIMADLFQVLEGTGPKKRGRKPGVKTTTISPGRGAGRSPKKGRKRGRPAAAGKPGRRARTGKPGRPPGKRGRPKKAALETAE